MAVIDAHNVSHWYGRRQILDSIELRADVGESIALTGRTGSGKSTLVSILAGLERPKKGKVSISGEDLRGLSRRQLANRRLRNMGVIFQAGELIPTLSAVENAALPLLLAGVDTKEATKRASRLLDDMAVSEIDIPARSLSGGERQRVSIARALANEPILILADEPTASLDKETRDIVADIIFELPTRRNCAVIVVSHDVEVAARADKVLELSNGKLNRRSMVLGK